jgi:type I restriction enzyme, S subunit
VRGPRVAESVWPTVPAWVALRDREEYGGNLPLLSLSARFGVRNRVEGEGRAASDDTSAYRVVRRGDLVINRLSARDGAYAVSQMEGLVSPAYWVLVPGPGFDSRWIDYVLRSAPYRAELARISKFMPPAQFDLPWDQFRLTPIPKPDLSIQQAVANALDAETVRIDAIIAERLRMISLLEERWAWTLNSLIAADWASDLILHRERRGVPPGWEVRKLGHLTDPAVPIVYGILVPGPRLDEGVPYIGAGEVQPHRLVLADLPKTSPEIAAQYPRSRVRSGELVYAIRGSFGAVEQVPHELDGVNLSRDAAGIRPSREVEARWLLFALKSHLAQEQFRRNEVGALVTGINIGDLKQVRLPVPPRDEQVRIAAAADESATQYSRAIGTLQNQLFLLHERRQALITAAVTGELDLPATA